MRMLGLIAIIPMSMLLMVSFFVLFAAAKTEMQGLKSFGRVIAILLWISAAVVLSIGIYTISTGHHPMMRMHHKMMMGGYDKGECKEIMEKCMSGKMEQGECKEMMEKCMSGKMEQGECKEMMKKC